MISEEKLQANRENGKKGGRPLATATKLAQATKEYIAIAIENELEAIVSKAIEQALGGDKSARDFLFDRAYGKAIQATELSGKDGKDLIPESISEEEKLRLLSLLHDRTSS